MLPHLCTQPGRGRGQGTDWQAGLPSGRLLGLLISLRPTQTGQFQGADRGRYARLNFSLCALHTELLSLPSWQTA